MSSSPHRHVTIVLSVRCHRTSSSGIKRYLLYAMACDITHIYHNHSSFTDIMLARCSHFLHMLSMLLVFWWRTVKAKIRASQWSWTPIQQAIPHELHYIMVEKKWHANAACLIDVQHRTGRSDVLRVKSQKRTSHGNMKTTKLLSHIETKKVFNLGADTSTVEWLSPSRGGALASATCDHVWKGPRPSDRGRSSRA